MFLRISLQVEASSTKSSKPETPFHNGFKSHCLVTENNFNLRLLDHQLWESLTFIIPKHFQPKRNFIRVFSHFQPETDQFRIKHQSRPKSKLSTTGKPCATRCTRASFIDIVGRFSQSAVFWECWSRGTHNTTQSEARLKVRRKLDRIKWLIQFCKDTQIIALVTCCWRIIITVYWFYSHQWRRMKIHWRNEESCCANV